MKVRFPWFGSILITFIGSVVLSLFVLSGFVFQAYQFRLSEVEQSYRSRVQTLDSYFSELRNNLVTLSKLPPTVGIFRAIENGGVDTLDGVKIENMKGRYIKMAQSFLESHPKLDRVELFFGSDQLVLRLERSNTDANEIAVTDPSSTFDPDRRVSSEEFAKWIHSTGMTGSNGVRFSEWSSSGPRTEFHFGTPILMDGVTRGVLVFSSHVDHMVKSFQKTSLDFLSNEWLVDSEGNILSQYSRAQGDWTSGSVSSTELFRNLTEDKSYRSVYSDWVRPIPEKSTYGLRMVANLEILPLVYNEAWNLRDKGFALLTFNGIFLAVLFLFMGVWIRSQNPGRDSNEWREKPEPLELQAPHLNGIENPQYQQLKSALEEIESEFSKGMQSPRRRIHLLMEILKQVENLNTTLTLELASDASDPRKLEYISEKLRKLVDISERTVADLSIAVAEPEQRMLEAQDILKKLKSNSAA